MFSLTSRTRYAHQIPWTSKAGDRTFAAIVVSNVVDIKVVQYLKDRHLEEPLLSAPDRHMPSNHEAKRGPRLGMLPSTN